VSYAAALAFPAAPLLRGSADLDLPRGNGDAGATASRSAAEVTSGAFDELVARHRDRVFRVALSVLGPGSEADAEDVAQEAFIRLHRSLGSGRTRFRGESRLGTWLYRVTFNLAVDLYRKRSRRGTTLGEDALAVLPAPDDDPHRSAREGERAGQVARLLATLPESHRAALHLHYWMGHSVAEIAELLDVAPGTIKAHLHRGREALRAALSPPPEEPRTGEDPS
jgi:RNA polymerase sigma-70 factor (ECF subfamily)